LLIALPTLVPRAWARRPWGGAAPGRLGRRGRDILELSTMIKGEARFFAFAADMLWSPDVIRDSRPKQRGLLLVYAACWAEYGLRYGLEPGSEVTGFGVSFPASTTTHQVDYVVGSVFQDAED
jgi:hypothetical protein